MATIIHSNKCNNGYKLEHGNIEHGNNKIRE